MLKRCCRCQQEYPATAEYFHRDKTRKDGLCHYCKTCVKERQKKYDMAGTSKRWRLANPKRSKEHWDNWTKRNRKSARERYREYYKQNIEHMREYQRKRYQLPHLKAAHAARERTRRARLAGAEGTHTQADIERLKHHQHNKCYWCGEDISQEYHVDHYIPLSRGGSNYPDNLVLACPACNLSRGNKLPDEWEGR